MPQTRSISIRARFGRLLIAAACSAVVIGMAPSASAVILTDAFRSEPVPMPFTGPVAPGPRALRPAQIRGDAMLAWAPGGLPADFAGEAERLHQVRRVVVAASDIIWMTRSERAGGRVIDRPERPYAIPIEANALDPGELSPFLQGVEPAVIQALEDGDGVLGRSSAELRRLGPGGVMEFDGRRVRIAAVLPDEVVGASELLVSRETGRRLGIQTDRYALVEPAGRATAVSLSGVLTAAAGRATVQVRRLGDAPYPRQGDLVLPPVMIKLRFGEFAARPDPDRPGFLEIDPGWIRDRIEYRTLPLVGNIECNERLWPYLLGAIRELQRRGLGGLISSEHGCFVPKFVMSSPGGGISKHAWGAALDLNLDGNRFGESPTQDPRLVAILEKWGFLWGGRFVTPDGNHFEYRRPTTG